MLLLNSSPPPVPLSGIAVAGDEDRPAGGDGQGDGRDDRADVGLEEVGAHAGDIADVVADVVGDGGGVAGVVLGDALLDLADEVAADVGGLGEDAAADAGEERDGGGAHAESGDDVGVFEDPPHEGDAEDADPDDGEAHDAAAREGDAEGPVEALLRRGGGADVGAHRDVHADNAGEAGGECAGEVGQRGRGDVAAGYSADVIELAQHVGVDEDPEHGENHDDEEEDRRVLALEDSALEEGLGPLADHSGDVLHRLVAGALAHDDRDEPESEDEGDAAGDKGDHQCG